MKTGNLYILVAAFLVALGIVACSDNSDPVLKPTSSDRYLSLSAQFNGETQSTSDEGTSQAIRYDFDSGSKTIDVSVTSNTLWKVDVTGGGWCSVNVARGQGDGSFTITILNNRSEERTSRITVTQIDDKGNEYDSGGSADIEITQEGSEVYITPSSLDVFPAENARTQEFEIVANAEWTLSVRPESELTGNFITIIPGEGMTEVAGSGQTFTGNANAKFRISLEDNGMAVVRKAYLELKSENGNSSVEILQQKSDYSFDVSPSTTRFVPAEGKGIDFTVYSPNYGWNISIPASNDWIKCSDTHFDKNDSRVAVKMTVEPNFSGRERSEIIYFVSDNTAYEHVPVSVVQSGFDLTFVVSLNGQSRVIDEAGGSFSFNVNSMFRWRIAKGADWLSVGTAEGVQSDDAVTVDVKVDRNSTNEQREDSIKVIPLTTDFNGISIDPAAVGITTIKIPVMQYGGQRPAVSTPWLLDGYGQTSASQSSADLEFSYYSPFVAIVKAGLQWMKASESDWRNAESNEVAVTDSKAGTITMTLDALDPATDYVARGYVIDSDGNVYYGSRTLPFRSAGQYPDASDNPTPTR